MCFGEVTSYTIHFPAMGKSNFNHDQRCYNFNNIAGNIEGSDVCDDGGSPAWMIVAIILMVVGFFAAAATVLWIYYYKKKIQGMIRLRKNNDMCKILAKHSNYYESG